MQLPGDTRQKSGQIIQCDFRAVLVRHVLLERDEPEIVVTRPGGAEIELEPRFK
jgi:hypothetical protein